MISKRANILLIEGKRGDAPVFFGGLTQKGYSVDTYQNGSSALENLEQTDPDIILINAASMETSGRRICQSIRQVTPDIPIILIVQPKNSNQARVSDEILLVLPFTLQKLLNRMRPLLPVENKNLIKAGPLHLDVDQRWVRYNKRQISLTPRLINLLKILMEHQDEVVEREYLFKQVWETDYTGDTRTLDVHISWLRQSLEEDPRHPRFIKTVRGVGYRLDVNPDAKPFLPGKKA